MPNNIVECVANISEGRRQHIIDAAAAEVTSIDGVRLLDIHTDADHNRSVLTFVGPAEAVEQAALRVIILATSEIDLTEHWGVHPRIGAADVVPFVPIGQTQMQTCVQIARDLAVIVSQELNLPVYLYGEAALKPARRELATFRKLGYETLRVRSSANDPVYKPDMGPNEFGTAGAVAIGARYPLVAYNIFLNTDDVTVAQKIASAVRHSSGGLRYVKALGLLVDDQAQVSMNLTNVQQTPIHHVQEMVRREAQRHGCQIARAELVGLVPKQALLDTAAWYLQLPELSSNQILEEQIFGNHLDDS